MVLGCTFILNALPGWCWAAAAAAAAWAWWAAAAAAWAWCAPKAEPGFEPATPPGLLADLCMCSAAACAIAACAAAMWGLALQDDNPGSKWG